jgi:hypothetical protein
MVAKTISIVGLAVFWAVLVGVGCANSTENDGTSTCTVSSNLPCACAIGSAVGTGRVVCVNGKQFCDCNPQAGASAGVAQAGVGGVIGMPTAGTTTGTGGKATGGKSGAKTAGAGGKTGTVGTTAGTGGGSTASGGRGGTTTRTGTAGSVGNSKDPVVPAVNGDCPNFATGAFNFMGLTGLLDVGQGSGGPLVFFWHGTVMAANSYLGIPVARITGEGGVIVAPDGPASGEAGAMCSGTMIFGDTTTWEVVDQITACAVKNHGVDPRRIYATGCSAGGLQSGCMAGRRSNYMAAVAPNSGGLTMGFMQWQDQTRIPAVMTMHGAPGVDVVGIDFSTSSASLDEATKAAGGFAIDCNHGGGHCGAPGDLYDAAITFMYAHPFGTKPSPYAGGLPAGFPSYCTIYE